VTHRVSESLKVLNAVPRRSNLIVRLLEGFGGHKQFLFLNEMSDAILSLCLKIKFQSKFIQLKSQERPVKILAIMGPFRKQIPFLELINE